MIRLLTICALLIVAAPANAGSLVLREDFSNRAGRWPDSASKNGVAVYTGTGKYQMTPTDDGTVGVVQAPRQADSPDVSIEAHLFMYAGIGTGASGVVCRYGSRDRYYAFVVSGAPGWLILKVEGGKPVPLARGPLPRGAVPGVVEGRLKAVCEGDRLSIAFNDRELGHARDSAFGNGSAGLIVMGEKSAGTSAMFDTFVLHSLQP